MWTVCERYKKSTEQAKRRLQNVDEEEEFKNNFDFVAQALGINLSSSEDEEESQMNKSQIMEEEKKIEEVDLDVQDSLTFYQSMIKVNEHGNEIEDYDDDESNIGPNNTSLQPDLTVSPSGSHGSNQSMNSKH